MQINDLNVSLAKNNEPKRGDGVPLSQLSKHPGRPKGSYHPATKHASSIAKRLKAAGVEWVADLANAIKANDETRINMWLKLLPYLVVTGSRTRVKRFKGKASKAAMVALEALEHG